MRIGACLLGESDLDVVRQDIRVTEWSTVEFITVLLQIQYEYWTERFAYDSFVLNRTVAALVGNQRNWLADVIV